MYMYARQRIKYEKKIEIENSIAGEKKIYIYMHTACGSAKAAAAVEWQHNKKCSDKTCESTNGCLLLWFYAIKFL